MTVRVPWARAQRASGPRRGSASAWGEDAIAGLSMRSRELANRPSPCNLLHFLFETATREGAASQEGPHGIGCPHATSRARQQDDPITMSQAAEQGRRHHPQGSPRFKSCARIRVRLRCQRRVLSRRGKRRTSVFNPVVLTSKPIESPRCTFRTAVPAGRPSVARCMCSSESDDSACTVEETSLEPAAAWCHLAGRIAYLQTEHKVIPQRRRIPRPRRAVPGRDQPQYPQMARLTLASIPCCRPAANPCRASAKTGAWRVFPSPLRCPRPWPWP